MMEANRVFLVILIFVPALFVFSFKILTGPFPFDLTMIDYIFLLVIVFIIFYAQISVISILKKETQISENLYYSPGFFKSKTELKISKKGLTLVLWSILPDGKAEQTSRLFETVTFENIQSIKGLHKNIVSNKTRGIKFITHLEITTKDNKIGYIAFSSHIRDEVLRLLKKFLKSNWDQIYTEVW